MQHKETTAADSSTTPHAVSIEEVSAALGTDAAAGMDTAEAQNRLTRYGPNTLRKHRAPNVLLLLLGQFNSPVVYLLLAASAFALALGEYVEAVAIILVLLINAAIGFVTELRAIRSIEALRQLSTHSVLVRRDKMVVTLPAERLVPGDIVVLDAGDMVAADMRVISSANLASDESALTGESLPVAKSVDPVSAETPLAERSSMLFKGCGITRGTGEAIVTGTGMNTELGRITRLIEESEPERSPLERQLGLLSRDLILFTLAIAAAVGISGVFSGQDPALMIKASVALAVAAIPEGLPIVATLALARGMLRMAKHNALIEQLSAVETLGETTVILTDKTGTLTENRMHVDRVQTAAGELTFDRNDGTFLLDARTVRPMPGDELEILLKSVALCNNASLDSTGSTGDPMEIALLEAAAASGLHRAALLKKHPEHAEHAFDVSTRMMATVHQGADGCIVAVKGAPEAVFACLHDVQDGLNNLPFDEEQDRRWREACDLLAGQGLRLLAVAGKKADYADTPVYENLTLYGVVGFQDPPRADIAAAIADARLAGISVVMVTGDHAATAKHISNAVGLADSASPVVHGSDMKPLETMGQAEKQAARSARIFSRMTPEQKLSLITLHQQAGEIVAMTGDGVNDAPALKKADIGIAMGQRGTQVAREAADMVLRDDAFSTIIHAVHEGRVIYTNIRRFTTYLLSCNLGEILIVGLAVLVGLPLPLLPLQILFLNLVTDVFPAFALGTIEADRNVLTRPPRPPSEPILARPQWIAILTHGSVIAAAVLASLVIALFLLKLEGDAVTTMCFFTLALAQLWHVFNMRNWRDGFAVNQLTRNTYVWLAILLCLGILSLAALQPWLSSVLRLVPLSLEAWGIVFALSLVPILFREMAALFVRMQRSLAEKPIRLLRE